MRKIFLFIIHSNYDPQGPRRYSLPQVLLKHSGEETARISKNYFSSWWQKRNKMAEFQRPQSSNAFRGNLSVGI